MSDDLGMTPNARGFQGFAEIEGSYGSMTRIFESSAVDPHIWLANVEPFDLNAWLSGDHSGGTKLATAHLPLEAAKTLRDQLTALIDYMEAET